MMNEKGTVKGYMLKEVPMDRDKGPVVQDFFVPVEMRRDGNYYADNTIYKGGLMICEACGNLIEDCECYRGKSLPERNEDVFDNSDDNWIHDPDMEDRS